MKFNINDYIINKDELKDMGLDKEIVVPGFSDDVKALEGMSDFNDSTFSLDEAFDTTPGFYESSSFDPEDYDFYMDPLS